MFFTFENECYTVFFALFDIFILLVEMIADHTRRGFPTVDCRTGTLQIPFLYNQLVKYLARRFSFNLITVHVMVLDNTSFFLFCFQLLEALIGMGYSRAEIEDSLTQCKYDDVFATYLLLGRKNSDVSIIKLLISYVVCSSVGYLFSALHQRVNLISNMQNIYIRNILRC